MARWTHRPTRQVSLPCYPPGKPPARAVNRAATRLAQTRRRWTVRIVRSPAKMPCRWGSATRQPERVEHALAAADVHGPVGDGQVRVAAAGAGRRAPLEHQGEQVRAGPGVEG